MVPNVTPYFFHLITGYGHSVGMSHEQFDQIFVFDLFHLKEPFYEVKVFHDKNERKAPREPMW